MYMICLFKVEDWRYESMFKILLKNIFLFIVLFLISLSVVDAKDLTSDLSIDSVKFCDDNICESPYDGENGVKAQTRFLVKMEWSLHAASAIEDGDQVIIPFANNVVEGQGVYLGSSFSWTDISDSNNNKIGQWRIQGSGENRKITIKFSDNAVGKTDISGIFITPKSMYVSFIYSDRVFPFTVGNNEYNLKINTNTLAEVRDLSGIANTDSSNNRATIITSSPKLTIKQLYNTNQYPDFTNAAILNDLYCELFLPKELNVTNISSLSIVSGVSLPTSLSSNKASTSFYYSSVLSFFTKVDQNENENYSDFKNRLDEFEYGIYTDDDGNMTVIVNFGSQPSSNLTYKTALSKLDNSVSEPGDYWHKKSPLTVDSNVQSLINSFLGSENRIGGKIASWGLYATLEFPTVKVDTNKTISSAWTWVNANNEVKSDLASTDIKLVVPSVVASISGASQLLLRDYDSKNEIIGATIKLQKKNGDSYEDVDEKVTDNTGMVMFRNLESGTYRYVQTGFLPHYKTDSFTTYSDSDMKNVITTFDFEKSEGNIIYATDEREKYTVSFLPGNHGDFSVQTYSNIPYGEVTPDYEANGRDEWLFDGWNPEKSTYVLGDATYTALWKKMVKVTTKYLEYGTDNVLSSEVTDIAENGTSYTTSSKNIQNYELYRTVGSASGTRGEEDIVVIYYYKKMTSQLNIKYLDCATREEIVDSTNEILYYGDNYDSDSYESSVTIPQNYNRVAVSKSENYKGVVNSKAINVEYCYSKKDSEVNTSITKQGDDAITSENDKVKYQIKYIADFTDYIGGASIVIKDRLPYKIDAANSNLAGGVYDDDKKTITWTMSKEINSYDEGRWNIQKNIELKYLNIDTTKDVMNNSVLGIIETDDRNVTVETNFNTLIDIKGKIIVKYVDKDSNNDLFDSINTTNKVGIVYKLDKKEIEGYKLVEHPEYDEYSYEEGEKTLYFIYERLKYKIVTKSITEGGTIKGDEIVYYGEDSTKNNIIITSEKGYYISKVTINGEDIEIPEKFSDLVIPKFTNMKEDMYINVSFSKFSEEVNVADTGKKTFLWIFGIFISLIGLSVIVFSISKKSYSK